MMYSKLVTRILSNGNNASGDKEAPSCRKDANAKATGQRKAFKIR
jgi:hypothetical protein